MKVKALKLGFYGKRRYEGDEFEIENESEMGSWMEAVEEEKKEAPKRRGRPPKSKAEEKVEDDGDNDVSES